MNAPALFPKSQRSESVNSPEIRVAYPYYHEKRTKNAAGIEFKKKDGTLNPRYSSSLMFPKLGADATSCPNYAFLWGLAVEAARKMWPQNVDGQGNWIWPVGAQLSIKDGDVPFVSKPKPGVIPKTPEQLAAANAWRKGYWIVEAENFLDPGPRIAKIINGIVTELPARVINGIAHYKGGDFGIVNIHAYAYQNETFGVNYGFDGFCFTREGEAIGNSGPRSSAQMFGGIAPAAMPVAAPSPAAPGVMPVAPAPVMPAPGAMPAPVATAPAYAPPPQPQQYAPPVAPAVPAAAVAPPPTIPAFPAPAAPTLPPMPPPR